MTLPAPDRARTFLSIVLAATALGAVELAVAQQGAAAPAPAAKATAAPAKPKAAGDKEDKSAASYSLGVIMGSQLHSSGVRPDDVSAERVEQGFRDALSGKVKLGENDKTNVNKLLHSAYDSLAENNHKAAEKFLADNGKKPEVTTTASGLEYKVISAGNGATPKPTDQVVVNYRGSLVDGTEFDSSYKRGEPAKFPLNHVIPGWSEGVGLMKPGAKYQFWIPPQLAYDLHSPPGIPPGSLLVFEVEMISAKAPAPAPAPAAAAPKVPAPAPK
jgi:FKBP-type peptidyl-prolyl cis-trans isomerase FkpA